MKRRVSLLIILLIIVGYVGICYAAPDTVERRMYGEAETFIGTEEIPGGSVSSLPKTGGIPAELFYAVGVVLVVSALIISGKRTKPESKC